MSRVERKVAISIAFSAAIRGAVPLGTPDLPGFPVVVEGKAAPVFESIIGGGG